MDEPSQQAEPAAEAKPSHGLGRYLVWAFVVLMVYVLSIGPVDRLIGERHLPRGVQIILGLFYMPWLYAYYKTQLHKPLGLYMHVWVPAHWDKNGESDD